MTALILLVVLVIWLAVVVRLSFALTFGLSRSPWRLPVIALLSAALFALPLIDEVVASQQFERLCGANTKVHIASNAAGRTVFLAEPGSARLEGTWVPVRRTPWRYLDATTGEAVLGWDILSASGGWLARGLTESKMPILFRGHCEPRGQIDPVQMRKDAGVVLIERSDLPKWRAEHGGAAKP